MQPPFPFLAFACPHTARCLSPYSTPRLDHTQLPSPQSNQFDQCLIFQVQTQVPFPRLHVSPAISLFLFFRALYAKRHLQHALPDKCAIEIHLHTFINWNPIFNFDFFLWNHHFTITSLSIRKWSRRISFVIYRISFVFASHLRLFLCFLSVGMDKFLKIKPTFSIIKNIYCIERESKPGRPRGRRAFYHWTIDA